MLNQMVARILTEMFKFNESNNPPTGSTGATVTTEANQDVSTQVAEDGTVLDTVRIDNEATVLAAEMAKAGAAPEVAVEATYGWYWTTDFGGAADQSVACPAK